MLLTGTFDGYIYAWNVDKILSEEFAENIKMKTETYKMVLMPGFPM